MYKRQVLSKPKVQYVPTQYTSQTTDKISKQEEKQLNELINEYEDIFSETPTQMTVCEHTITVTDSTKFVRRTHPIPMHYEEEVETEVRCMLDNNVIERSNSSFLNPLVVVKKKNGDIRLCLDMRELNSIIMKKYDCAQMCIRDRFTFEVMLI